MYYWENKSLFFDVTKNGQIFPSKVCHFQYDHRFLLSREMGNIRTCKEVRLPKLTQFKLSLQYSFWHISSCLQMNNNLRTISPSYFLQNILIKISNVCFKSF